MFLSADNHSCSSLFFLRIRKIWALLFKRWKRLARSKWSSKRIMDHIIHYLFLPSCCNINGRRNIPTPQYPTRNIILHNNDYFHLYIHILQYQCNRNSLNINESKAKTTTRTTNSSKQIHDKTAHTSRTSKQSTKLPRI